MAKKDNAWAELELHVVAEFACPDYCSVEIDIEEMHGNTKVTWIRDEVRRQHSMRHVARGDFRFSAIRHPFEPGDSNECLVPGCGKPKEKHDA